ncbi:hypothetical protein JCM14202_2346 [Agrilactobacillus composti DSM 18527 = JCM 14202]|nr:DUF4811 domain-containing protein [Agrilactobacillus composti]GAF40447.1 hypothetical protein JCM14202_2346 [Agrilactobacillus composti DSM 18527 = JCM 14202]
MLLFLLLIGILAFAIVMIGMPRSVAKYMLICLSLVVSLGSIVMFLGNDISHWGMIENTVVDDRPLAPAATVQGTNVLLYKRLGNGKEKITIYKTNAKQKKPKTTKADVTTTNQLTRSDTVQNPVLERTRYQYSYKNSFYRLLFAGTNSDDRFIKEANEFKVPENWAVLSTDQVATLQKQAKTTQKQAKAKVEQAVAAQVQAAKAKDPNMSAEQQQQLVKTIEAAAKKQMAQQVQATLLQMSLK